MCVAPLQLWLLAGREVISRGLSQSVLALSPLRRKSRWATARQTHEVAQVTGAGTRGASAPAPGRARTGSSRPICWPAYRRDWSRRSRAPRRGAGAVRRGWDVRVGHEVGEVAGDHRAVSAQWTDNGRTVLVWLALRAVCFSVARPVGVGA
jgi:hypothetical protein